MQKLNFGFKMLEDDVDHFYIRFMVIDSGIGIESFRQANIFNLFENNKKVPLENYFKIRN